MTATDVKSQIVNDIEAADSRATQRARLLGAVQPLQNAAVNARSLAGHYRRYDLTRGNQGLTEMAAELRSVALLVITAEDPRFNDQVGSLAAILERLIAAQASEDWITVADVLEYDLEPSIRVWATAIADLVAR